MVVSDSHERRRPMFKKWRDLEEEFRSGWAPLASDLLGPRGENAEWRVTMLTGPIPDLGGSLLRHRKRFYRGDGRVVRGHNVFRRGWGWGCFEIRFGVSGLDWRPVLCLVYDVPANMFCARLVSDEVRVVAPRGELFAEPSLPSELLGRFCYGGIFLGYFRLDRLGIEVVSASST
jgi:hypothetical protein